MIIASPLGQTRQVLNRNHCSADGRLTVAVPPDAHALLVGQREAVGIRLRGQADAGLGGVVGKLRVRPLNLFSLCLESAEARLNAVMSCETAQTTVNRLSHHLISQVMTHNVEQNETARPQVQVEWGLCTKWRGASAAINIDPTVLHRHVTSTKGSGLSRRPSIALIALGERCDGIVTDIPIA